MYEALISSYLKLVMKILCKNSCVFENKHFSFFITDSYLVERGGENVFSLQHSRGIFLHHSIGVFSGGGEH